MLEFASPSFDAKETESVLVEPPSLTCADLGHGTSESDLPDGHQNEFIMESGDKTPPGSEPELPTELTPSIIRDRYGLGSTSSLHHKFLVEAYFDGERVRAKVERLPKSPDEEPTHIFDLYEKAEEMINFIEEDIVQSRHQAGRGLAKEGISPQSENVERMIMSSENIQLERSVLRRGEGCTVRLPVQQKDLLETVQGQPGYTATLYIHRIGKHRLEKVGERAGVYTGAGSIPVEVKPGVLSEGMCKFEAVAHFFIEGADMPHDIQFWESRVLTVIG